MKNAEELLEEAIKELEDVSKSISQDNIEELLHNEDKICFITCNSYVKPKYSLGPAPVNDAVTVAKHHIQHGFKCVHLHNPSPKLFLNRFDEVLQMRLTHLTIFFGGHGGVVNNESVIFFDTGYIKSSLLNSHIKKYARKDTMKLIISDCCGAGSVWCSTKLPPNTISICSSPGIKPSKQAVVCNKAQGLFTFFFWRNAEKLQSQPISAIIRATNRYLSKFDQEIKCESNAENLKERCLSDLSGKAQNIQQ
jgi:hypothetical protein